MVSVVVNVSLCKSQQTTERSYTEMVLSTGDTLDQTSFRPFTQDSAYHDLSFNTNSFY